MDDWIDPSTNEWSLVSSGRIAPDLSVVRRSATLLLRGLGTLMLSAAVLLSTGAIPLLSLPDFEPSSSAPTSPVAWERLSPRVDGVSLAGSADEARRVLGEPNQTFVHGRLHVMSFGPHYEATRYELSDTTVGLDGFGHTVRISGQCLELAGQPSLCVGASAHDVKQVLGASIDQWFPDDANDKHFYWSYRGQSATGGLTELRLAFAPDTHRLERIILRRL